MTSKYYSTCRGASIIALLISLLLVSKPAIADTVYLPLVAAGQSEDEGAEDISTSDGTCLFWRSNNDIYLSIFITVAGKDLYVVSSTEREDEPYVIPMYPHTIQVGEVDGNGESIVGYTWNGFIKEIHCASQFVHW